MPTVVESELGGALSRIAEEFRIRAAAEKDYRAGTFYIALEVLRIRWEAHAWPAEAIEAGAGDRR